MNDHAKLHIFGKEGIFNRRRKKSNIISKEDLERVRDKNISKVAILSPVERKILNEYRIEQYQQSMPDNSPAKR